MEIAIGLLALFFLCSKYVDNAATFILTMDIQGIELEYVDDQIPKSHGGYVIIIPCLISASCIGYDRARRKQYNDKILRSWESVTKVVGNRPLHNK